VVSVLDCIDWIARRELLQNAIGSVPAAVIHDNNPVGRKHFSHYAVNLEHKWFERVFLVKCGQEYINHVCGKTSLVPASSHVSREIIWRGAWLEKSIANTHSAKCLRLKS